MSKEIVVTHGPVNEGISQLRSSGQSLDTTFATEIDGDNKLDIITKCNEIKQQYDEVFALFATLFLNNVESTEDAVAAFEETERLIAGDIKLMK